MRWRSASWRFITTRRWRGWLRLTVLVVLSRMVLGLHYPSDVLAGVLLGTGLALLALQF